MGVPTGHTKPMKEMVRKRTGSAMAKAEDTGVLCNTFVFYVFWDPTYKELRGSGHLPPGMDMPDVNRFLRDYFEDDTRSVRTKRRRNTRRQGLRRSTDVREEIIVEASQSGGEANFENEVNNQVSTVSSFEPHPPISEVQRSHNDPTTDSEAPGTAVWRESQNNSGGGLEISVGTIHLNTNDIPADSADVDVDADGDWDIIFAPGHESETGGEAELLALESMPTSRDSEGSQLIESVFSDPRIRRRVIVERALGLILEFREIFRA